MLESVVGWGEPTLHSLLSGLAWAVHTKTLQCIFGADPSGWGKILIVVFCAMHLWWCHLCDWFHPHLILNFNLFLLSFTFGELDHGLPLAAQLVQLSAMDVLGATMMKNVVKCDNTCDMQPLVNHHIFERILCFLVTPESIPVWVWSNPSQLSLSL